MATTYYSLPTVNGSDTADFVNAINGLATATDAALRNVANDVPNVDNITSQIATINSEITNIKATLTTTTSTANTASTTATSALSIAQNVSAQWVAAPVPVLESYVAKYITNPDNLTADCWGNVITLKCAASNLEYGVKNVVGKIKPGYLPDGTLLIAVLQQQTQGSPWAYFTVDPENGEIGINPTYDGAKPQTTTTISCMFAYLKSVTN